MKLQILATLFLIKISTPVMAEPISNNAFCQYFRHFEHPVASVQAPCYFKQFDKNNDTSKTDIYVQLIDGTSLFYDGTKRGAEYIFTKTSEGFSLKREGKSTLRIQL